MCACPSSRRWPALVRQLRHPSSPSPSKSHIWLSGENYTALQAFCPSARIPAGARVAAPSDGPRLSLRCWCCQALCLPPDLFGGPRAPSGVLCSCPRSDMMCGVRARVALCLGLLLVASSASGALPEAAGAGGRLMALTLQRTRQNALQLLTSAATSLRGCISLAEAQQRPRPPPPLRCTGAAAACRCRWFPSPPCAGRRLRADAEQPVVGVVAPVVGSVPLERGPAPGPEVSVAQWLPRMASALRVGQPPPGCRLPPALHPPCQLAATTHPSLAGRPAAHRAANPGGWHHHRACR